MRQLRGFVVHQSTSTSLQWMQTGDKDVLQPIPNTDWKKPSPGLSRKHSRRESHQKMYDRKYDWNGIDWITRHWWRRSSCLVPVLKNTLGFNCYQCYSSKLHIIPIKQQVNAVTTCHHHDSLGDYKITLTWKRLIPVAYDRFSQGRTLSGCMLESVWTVCTSQQKRTRGDKALFSLIVQPPTPFPHSMRRVTKHYILPYVPEILMITWAVLLLNSKYIY